MTTAPRFADGTDTNAVVDALQEHGTVLIDQLIDHGPSAPSTTRSTTPSPRPKREPRR